MKNAGKVLILGASSYIGRNLYARLGKERSLGTFNNHPLEGCVHFNILKDNLTGIIKDHKLFSHAVIMLGNTKPDLCARNAKESDYLNVKRVCDIIDELSGMGITPVFMSTEVVFDGIKGNYIETDKANPILRYGRQKVEVEEYLKNKSKRFIILRLAKVYGYDPNDGTLFTSWSGKIMRNEEIICARDSIFSPVHVEDAAEGIIRLIKNESRGIFHLANKTAYTRLEMLKTLVKHLKGHAPQVELKISECSMLDLPTVEKRPLNISLNPAKIIRETGLAIRDIEESCKFITEKAFCRIN
jgi:dTDP-4-dehydrorhamnose reductase